jgi:hypothetical protein
VSTRTNIFLSANLTAVKGEVLYLENFALFFIRTKAVKLIAKRIAKNNIIFFIIRVLDYTKLYNSCVTYLFILMKDL